MWKVILLPEEPVQAFQEGPQGCCVQKDSVKPLVSVMAVANNSYSDEM